MKRIFTDGITCWTVAAALGFVLCGALSIRAAEPDNGGLDVVQVRPNFYMIAGAGGNIGVQIGSDGVVLVRRRHRGCHRQVLAAIKKLTDAADPLHHQRQRGPGFRGRQREAGQSRTDHFHQCSRQRGSGRDHDQRRRGVDSGA